MRTVVLGHGIRQMRAKTHMKPLARELAGRGVDTHFADYGYVLIPTTNERAVRAILNATRDGEDLAVYSNAAWAAVVAAERGLKIRHLYLISPALNRNWKFSKNIERITVFYTPGDEVTPLGKLWRKVTRVLPWRWKNPHGWGEMGTRGPRTIDSRVTAIRIPPEVGHAWWKNEGAVQFIAYKIAEDAA